MSGWRLLVIALGLAACSGSSAPEVPAPSVPAAAAGVSRVSESGPVRATVTVTPGQARVGDRLTVELVVEAEPGVTVTLPPFGDALGRFAVVEFVPREERAADGRLRASQRYVLDSPLSGRHRIPAFRIEVTDDRRGAGRTAQDAGAVGAVEELLTEEIPLEIASVLAEDAARELRPLRGALAELRADGARWPWWVAGGGLVIVAGLLLRALAGRRTRRRQESAFDAALRRLGALGGRLPSGDEADAWYVELSAAIRRYLEDRFTIRAPELTTEEFLGVARRSSGLTAIHSALLGDFLVQCDRVKFAGYRPGDAETQAALTAARRFVDETRLERDDQQEPGAADEPPGSGTVAA